MFIDPTALGTLSLDAAGIIAIADLDTITRRTAIIGSASYFDPLVLAPGIHKQQNATELAKGENPACAALTTGYVFRVENPATVHYLQKVGQTGKLVRLIVEKVKPQHISKGAVSLKAGLLSSIFFFICPALTILATSIIVALKDWWAFSVIMALMLARLLNVFVIRQRAQIGWKGDLEETDEGAKLIILLSQDRWILLQGAVDDLKAVTAGQWLRDANDMERFLTAVATLLVFATAVLAGNSTKVGALVTIGLLLLSNSFLGLSNSFAEHFHIFNRRVRVNGPPKPYTRRLRLAEDLIQNEANGEREWAVQLGMVLPTSSVGTNEKTGNSKVYTTKL